MGQRHLQIAREAKVTEPLIYYHFEGKDDLFTHIVRNGFEAYFARLESLNQKTSTQFEKIENLFTLHFDFIKERPDEIYLVVSACPAKLKDAQHVCTQKLDKQRKWLTSYLKKCIKEGMASGEFKKMPVIRDGDTAACLHQWHHPSAHPETGVTQGHEKSGRGILSQKHGETGLVGKKRLLNVLLHRHRWIRSP